MYVDNVCKFVNEKNKSSGYSSAYFVFERNVKKPIFYTDIYNKIYCITNGHGILHLDGKTVSLNTGDVFFSFPAKQFSIEGSDNFQFYFVGFSGAAKASLMERAGVSKQNFLFHPDTKVQKTWQHCFEISDNLNLDIIIESVIIYTFSVIIHENNGEKDKMPKEEPIFRIKKIINDNLFDKNLNLDMIAEASSYNKNYISTLFRQQENMTLISYITSLRLQLAVSLMENGHTSVKDISDMSGFSDSMYFAKVFRKYYSKSPSEYIWELSETKKDKV